MCRSIPRNRIGRFCRLLPEAVLTTYEAPAGEQRADFPKSSQKETLLELLDWADVICMGCGLGQSDVSKELVRTVLTYNTKPCVIDADGLNILAGLGEEERAGYSFMADRYVLTPHMKEMSRLSACPVEEIRACRAKMLREFVQKEQVVCALKDSRTLTAAPGRALCLNLTGNAAMAKGGAGDVLSGVITGLLAQKLPTYEAAALGVYLHGLAGDAVRKEKGAYSVLAGDIAEALSEILRTLEEEKR
ncbi:NAD(P)H-hydrate dehydratase [Roseburia hominis]